MAHRKGAALSRMSRRAHENIPTNTPWMPDLIIGIDFGAIGTAVAYSNGPTWSQPEVISVWPGSGAHVFATKVPTRVSYSRDDPKKVRAWGFNCDFEDPTQVVCKNFKTNLYWDGIKSTEVLEVQDARRHTVDFLRHLHNYVIRTIDPHHDAKAIEYVFSIPSAWPVSNTRDEFRPLIEAAGFAHQKRNRITVLLTEPEATICSIMDPKSSDRTAMLVCHAGGLSTSVDLLVALPSPPGLAVSTMSVFTKTRAIGSSHIDYQIQDEIKAQLGIEGESIPRNLMQQGTYRSYKHTFGAPMWPSHALNLAGPVQPGSKIIPPGMGNTIHRFDMTESAFRAIFEAQITKLFQLLDEALSTTTKSVPDRNIKLVMSGGFSDSPELRQRFEDWFSNAQRRWIGHELSSVFTADGKLQVVQGLVKHSILEQIARPEESEKPVPLAKKPEVLFEDETYRPSRASSIMTTETKYSEATTVQDGRQSVDLVFGGMAFHINRNGSRIMSGDESTETLPAYTERPV